MATVAGRQGGGTAPVPAHQLVYRRLRNLILFGEMAPGQAVTIQGLVDQLGAGMTPVREAIRRLIAEGALELQGNRRVCVPVLSPDNIEELIFARMSIEPQLTVRASNSASPRDIAELERIDSSLDGAIASGDVQAYLQQNYRFHEKLYSMAASPILSSVALGLWLRFGPSLRVVCGRMGTQNLPDMHKEILAAMARGDGDGAAAAMRQDVMQGMDQMRRAIRAEAAATDSN